MTATTQTCDIGVRTAVVCRVRWLSIGFDFVAEDILNEGDWCRCPCVGLYHDDGFLGELEFKL